MSRGPSAHELWAECVRTMRDVGDAATIPTLRTLLCVGRVVGWWGGGVVVGGGGVAVLDAAGAAWSVG